jgi:hypothetical protein
VSIEGRGRFSIKQLSAVMIGVFIVTGILTLSSATRIRQEQVPLQNEVKVTLKLVQVYVTDKRE